MNILRFCRSIVVVTMILTIATPVGGAAADHAVRSPAIAYTVNATGDAPDASPGDGVCQTSAGVCTLRAAIEESNANPDADTIYFALSYPATIVLTSALPPISQTLTIEGPGADNLTVDGANAYRHFRVLTGVETHIAGLRLYNGRVTSADGGSIYNQGILTLDDATVDDNRAYGSGAGGGIYNTGVLTVTHSVISENRTVDGGGAGIYNTGTLAVLDSTIVDNRATLNGDGGGICNDYAGRATITRCTISANRAQFGGGLGNGHTNSRMTVVDSVIQGNRATSGSGGGISNSGQALLTVINSTISRNWAAATGAFSGLGGGIDNWDSDAVLYNTTVVSNTGRVGGAVYNYGETFQIKSTILANNVDSSGDRECYNTNGGSIVSQGYNLVEAPGNCTFSGGGVITGTDPLLSPLADHGGDTLTHALLPGSPVLDQGSCTSPLLTADQRGRPRPLDVLTIANADDGCDIGAYEAHVELSMTKSVDDDNPQPDQEILFTIVVTNHGAVTATHALVSDPLPADLQFLGPITLEPPGAGTVGVAPPVLASEITIPPGQAITVTVPCAVRIETTPGTVITNSAAITSSEVITPQMGVVSLLVDKMDTATRITSYTPSPSNLGQPVTVYYAVTAIFGSPTGQVIVNTRGMTCTATVAEGECNLTFFAAGSYTLTATYVGDDNYYGSTSKKIALHIVRKGQTSMTITAHLPHPSAVGQAVTVSYTVTADVGTPTGQVTVNAGEASCTGTVAQGQCALTFFTAGPKTMTATYAGDDNYYGSTSPAVVHTVDKGQTNTTITAHLPNPSDLDEAVTVSYAVATDFVNPGDQASAPTGLVTVSAGKVSCTGTVAQGQCALTFSTAGTKAITATYAGDGNYLGSTSLSVAHTVDKGKTTTAISAHIPHPSTVGQAVTISYTVATDSVSPVPQTSVPTGLVTVSAGGITCTGTVAQGQCTLTFLTAGLKTLTATYAGDDNYLGSTSPDVAHIVNKGESATGITAHLPNPSSVDQNVVVWYDVTVPAGTPTGQVTVSGGGALCTGTVAQGHCTLSFSSVGTKTLTAVYAGDDNYLGSTSPVVTHVVNDKSPSTTSITAHLPHPSAVGQAVTVSYTVTAPTGDPTGQVIVSAGGITCTGTVAQGQCALTFHSVGDKLLTAIYEGDDDCNGSISPPVTHTVNQAGTTTAITAHTPDPSQVGQAVTVSYNVTSPWGTPTGDVVVSDGGTSCSSTVAAGQCVLVLSAAGSYTLTAAYGGDDSFAESVSAGVLHRVSYVVYIPLVLKEP